MNFTRKKTWTDHPQVFVEKVAYALAKSCDNSLYLSGHVYDPIPVRGTTLLRCRIAFDREFIDMGGKTFYGYEYRAQNTEECNFLDNAAKRAAHEFLRNTCFTIISRLNSLDYSNYGLTVSLKASIFGQGISVIC